MTKISRQCLCFVFLMVILAVQLAAQAARADQDQLAQLRASFETQLPQMKVKLQKAANLKLTGVPLGAAITPAQCVQISARISANYKINPFAAEYEGGKTFSLDCSGGAHDNYFQAVKVKTNFGLAAAYALQVDRQFADSEVIRTIFLDANFKLLEIDDFEAVIVNGKKIPFAYCVAALDGAGNNYRGYFKAPGYEYLGNEFQYSSADGKIPLLTEASYPKKDDPKTQVRKFIFNRAAAGDWSDFLLLLTHSWNLGGFYFYGNKVYHRANGTDEITVYSAGDKEVCASGLMIRNFIQPAHNVSELPDPAKYNQCEKTWGPGQGLEAGMMLPLFPLKR